MKIIEFIRDYTMLLVFMLSAFWVTGTGVTLLPQIALVASEGSLFPFIYALGTICFSVVFIYFGLKYLKIFN